MWQGNPYREKLRLSMRGAIDFARRRQEKKQLLGKPFVAVTLTLDEAMSVLERQNWLCALTRMRFYSVGDHSYGPSRPSLDRVLHDGLYALGNVRVIFLGVNAMRGRGTDAEMYEIARAIAANARD